MASDIPISLAVDLGPLKFEEPGDGGIRNLRLRAGIR